MIGCFARVLSISCPSFDLFFLVIRLFVSFPFPFFFLFLSMFCPFLEVDISVCVKHYSHIHLYMNKEIARFIIILLRLTLLYWKQRRECLTQLSIFFFHFPRPMPMEKGWNHHFSAETKERPKQWTHTSLPTLGQDTGKDEVLPFLFL